MISAAILASLLIGGYDCREIPRLPDTDTPGRMFLTASGAVAGHWYRFVAPGHAGAALAKPFVWVEGKLLPLPLGNAEYGRVQYADDHAILGDVDGSAAMWTPDEKQGWAEAHLKVLCKNGYGVWIDAERAVYIQSDDLVRIWRDGQFKDVAMRRLGLVGLDRTGRWFANEFSANGGVGIGRVAARGFVYGKSGWKTLHPDGYDTSRIDGINASGAAVGSVLKNSWRAGIWDTAGFRELPSDKGYADAEAINEGGQIVGEAHVGKELHPVLWEQGKPQDLSKWIPDPEATNAISINDRGLIVVVNNSSGGRAFVLTPKP